LDGLRESNRIGRFLRRHQFDVRRCAILPAQAMKHNEPVKRYDFSRVRKSGQERNRVCTPARRFFNESMKKIKTIHSCFPAAKIICAFGPGIPHWPTVGESAYPLKTKNS
jgi:hypothetical protein